MARTFRIRHLPSLPGTARRFAFTHSDGWRQKEKLILALAARLAPQTTVATHTLFGPVRIDHTQDGDARSIVDTLEKQVVVPLLSPGSHPWISRYGVNIRIAKYYRRKAHRRIRRKAKHLLNKSGRDFDDMVMPAWYEHWDRWDIT